MEARKGNKKEREQKEGKKMKQGKRRDAMKTTIPRKKSKVQGVTNRSVNKKLRRTTRSVLK